MDDNLINRLPNGDTAHIPDSRRRHRLSDEGFPMSLKRVSQRHETWRADWSRLPDIKPANFFPPAPLSLRTGVNDGTL
jgi:hypothetical protein